MNVPRELLTLRNFDTWDRDWLTRFVARTCRHSRDGIRDVLALQHLPEYGVVTVQMASGNRRDNELAAIGVGTGISHGQNARPVKTNPGTISSSNW